MRHCLLVSSYLKVERSRSVIDHDWPRSSSDAVATMVSSLLVDHETLRRAAAAQRGTVISAHSAGPDEGYSDRRTCLDLAQQILLEFR